MIVIIFIKRQTFKRYDLKSFLGIITSLIKVLVLNKP